MEAEAGWASENHRFATNKHICPNVFQKNQLSKSAKQVWDSVGHPLMKLVPKVWVCLGVSIKGSMDWLKGKSFRSHFWASPCPNQGHSTTQPPRQVIHVIKYHKYILTYQHKTHPSMRRLVNYHKIHVVAKLNAYRAITPSSGQMVNICQHQVCTLGLGEKLYCHSHNNFVCAYSVHILLYVAGWCWLFSFLRASECSRVVFVARISARPGLQSIDWFKGRSTGKSHFSWENLWFPVDFPFLSTHWFKRWVLGVVGDKHPDLSTGRTKQRLRHGWEILSWRLSVYQCMVYIAPLRMGNYGKIIGKISDMHYDHQWRLLDGQIYELWPWDVPAHHLRCPRRPQGT